MAVGREGRTGNVTISLRQCKDGQFQPVEDTLWIVLCNFGCLASIRAIVLEFTANKQTTNNYMQYLSRVTSVFSELPSRLSGECSTAECGLPSADHGPFKGFARTSAR